jgi:hypothetical protein
MKPGDICSMRSLCSRAATCRHALNELDENLRRYVTTTTWGEGCRDFIEATPKDEEKA